MTTEFRAFGPPGTGKTRWLSRQLKRACDKYPVHKIFACSFTKAAAVELAGRETGIPKENIGTIHSMCYRHMGTPEIIETRKDLIEEWNQEFPSMAMANVRTDIDDPYDEAKTGNDDLQEWNRNRGMLSQTKLPYPFSGAWEKFKKDHEAVDFTDLLLNAPEDIGASVLMLDEAQDLTPLQWKIVRAWGSHADKFIVAGDDDQCIYDFLGADPLVFLADLPEENKKHLHQSYRLSRAIYEYAEKWISQLDGQREPKEYAPAREGGIVANSPWRLEDPKMFGQHLLNRHVKNGQTVMVLASCGYMLNPIIKELRGSGVPFHNPYRRAKGQWNPLRGGPIRFQAFLKCCEALAHDSWLPVADIWRKWIDMVQSDGNLARGAKAALKRHEGPVSDSDVTGWITLPVLEAMERQDLEWIYQHMTRTFQDAMEFTIAIYRQGGVEALESTPQITIGTIHSVKGGEADVVYIFPDMSYKASEHREHHHGGAEALVRLVYVGMTRARNELYLCRESGTYQWRWL